MVRPRRVKGRALKQRDWFRVPKKSDVQLRLTAEQIKKQNRSRMFSYIFLGGIFAALIIILILKKIFAG